MFINDNVCGHTFCIDCIRAHVGAKINENVANVRCPNPDCKGLIGPNVCRYIRPEEVLERWENALCESLIIGSQKLYCPFKDCSAPLLVDENGVVMYYEDYRMPTLRLLAGAVLNAKVRGGPTSTLPFVTSSMSATPEREDEHLVDSSAAPIIATVVTTTADVATTSKEAPARETPAKPSFLLWFVYRGGTDHAPGGFSDVSGSDFLVGDIRTRSRQISLSAEVRMHAEYNIKEREDEGCEAEAADGHPSPCMKLLDSGEQEAADSDALVTNLLSRKLISLVDQVHALEASSVGHQEKVTAYEKFVDQLEKFQDDKIKEVNVKLEKLERDVCCDVLHLEEIPRVDQLMVPIHHSPDHRVIGASALSLSLDVSNFRVQKIKENLANRSTSAVVAAPAGTTTALSVTFASASVVRPISTDDYEVVQVDGHGGGGTKDQIGGNNVDPFASVDDVDLNLQ
ncbi:zinc finger, C6HC-type containing protein [Tanacetum coccineum]